MRRFTRTSPIAHSRRALRFAQGLMLLGCVLLAAPSHAQTLTSIAVTPANASVPSGLTQQFTATGTYSDGSTQNITASVTWSVTSSTVASINSVGLGTGLAVGSTTVQAASGSVSGSTPMTVTASNLVAWWQFNEGSGTTAADSTADGFIATLANGVSWVTGKLGGAVSANGSNQYVSTPAINLSSTSAVTWTAWVNRTYSTSGGHTLFENSANFNGSMTGFGLFPDDGSDCGNSTALMTGVHGNVGYTINCYSQPSSGVWHHLAVVYDKTQPGTSVISLYIDGVLQAPSKQLYTATNTNPFGNNPLYLFSRGGTAEYAAGEVDDLRLYSEALSASQIQQIYEQGSASLVSLAVTPANASIAKGATQQYTATGTYSDGSTQNLTSSATWTSSSTASATITSAGVATAVALGSTTIQAASGSIAGSAGLTVTAPALQSIAVTPANPLIASGAAQQFTATGTYSDGSTQNLTGSVAWTSTNTSVASINSGGLATGASVGSTTIQATSGSVTGSTGLTVTATLVSVTVTPTNPSIGKGSTQQFTATAVYSDNSTQNVTSLASWTSTNTGVATVNSSGLATAVATGASTVHAIYGSFTGSTTLTVTAAALVSIAVTPANPSVAVGANEQFTATGTYSDSSTQNLTNSVAWTSTNTTVATINSAGLATGATVGTTTIQAVSGSITGSTTLTVTASNLVAWWKFDDGSGTTAVDSSGNGYNATLVNGVSWVTGKIGDAVSANGVNQYVDTPAINLSATSTITWAAWVNRTYSTAGGHTLFENSTNFNSSTTSFGFFPDDGPDCGSSSAMMTGVHGNVGYTINCYGQPSSGVWHHVAVVYDKTQPGTSVISLYIDGVLQAPSKQLFTATNTNSFGSNPLYVFSRGGTSEYAAGEVDDLRLYNQALSASQIQQIYQEGAASLVSLAVTPASASIGKGTTEQYTATGTYSDGSTQNVTNSVTWTSSSTATATISSAGLATGVALGSTTIQAVSGSITGSTGLTVTAATLVSIAVTPANASITKGSTLQYTATGTYTDGSTQNLTGSVIWSSTSTATATITSAGLATGVSTGSTTIQATSGSITGSTGLAVTATLMSIAVTPANSSVPSGAALQFTATGTYSDGSTLNLTNSVTWTSTNTAVATINRAGLATGVSTGSTTIQAASGSISGSTTLTVTALTLVSIGITPTNGQVAAGSTLQLTATGLYNDGSTQNLTNSVAWSSGNAALATISSTGVLTGVATGSTTIQASSGSISSSTPLTVTPSGLVGWWTFDDGSGTTAADSSGNSYNATLFNGVSWVTGEIGDAVSANGVNQYVGTPSINLSSTSAVTIAAWVNRIYSTAGNTTLVEDSTNFNSVTTGFGVFPDDPGCHGIMAGVHGNTGYSISCFTPPASGAWHHLAFIFNKTLPGNQQVGLYIDGVLQTPTVNLYSAANTNAFGNNPLYLFSRGGTQQFAAGEMDDLRLYNRALSASEIGQVYNLGASSGSGALQSINLTPASSAIATGAVQQFTATGSYSNSTTQNLSSSVTWTSTNASVATVNSTGAVTGLAAGSTSIQATSGSVVGTTGLTVVPTVGQFGQWSSGDGGATSASTTFQSSKASSGDLILVFSHWDNQSITASVTDQLGNTYIPIFSPANVGTADRFQVWYAKNITGGAALGVTVTYSARTSSISVVDVMEYSGLDTSAPLDVFTSATGNSNFQSSGNLPVTTSSSETVVGLFGYSGYAGPYTAGTGFNFRNYDASTMLEDQAVDATGVYSAAASSALSTTWAAFAIGFKNTTPGPPGLGLNPTTVTAGGTSTGTVTLNAPAPSGGALVTLSSGNPAIVTVPASVTVTTGATTATFTVNTSAVTFSTTVSISANYGDTQTASLTVTPTTMSQVASDSFNRANASTLGSNWTPLVGASTNVAFQIVNDQIEPAAAGPSIAKEMYYGGLNWTPDHYSQVQIVAANGGGNEGPAVRMTSNDTHYACLVYSTGAGNASVGIILDNAATYSTLASSTTATVNPGDVVRCTVQGTTLTMTDQTSLTTLLTASDSTLPSGYAGLIDYAGSGALTNYLMANWSAGANAASLGRQQLASDNFNRPNALNLGDNWAIGAGHGPIQIVNDQMEPYPAGGPQPSKQHYIAYGPLPNDQWSEFQLVLEDTLGDVAAEVRASDSTDDMYVCDVNMTGPAGTAETRIVKVLNGTIITLITDQRWSAVSAGDYIRGQVQGNLISLIDVTSGSLLLSAFDTAFASGYPGISMQALTGNPSDHIAANWSGGSFQ